jgi:hypothetical protein
VGDLFDFSPNSQEIAAPELADLFFGVAAANEFQRDVKASAALFQPSIPT